MNLILLAGNSIRNEDWIYKVDKKLSSQFDKTFVQHYDHWKNGGTMIDLDLEQKSLGNKIGSYYPYAVFAKSAGCILAIKSMAQGTIAPERCLFVGFPIHLIENMHLPVTKWIRDIRVPLTIVQNEHDPAGEYEQVAAYIQQADNPNITVRMLEGNSTHDYDDLDKISELSRSVLAS